MHTKIRIRAGEAPAAGMLARTGQTVEVDVDTDASTVEAVDAIVSTAQDAATELASAAGIVAYEPEREPSVVVAEVSGLDVPPLQRQMHEAINEAVPVMQTAIGDIRDQGMTTTADALEGTMKELEKSLVLTTEDEEQQA